MSAVVSQLWTDVAIIGGGPVGASLAVELGLRGVPTVLVERSDISHPPQRGNIRARGVSIRSMEHLRRWGVADRMRRRVTVPLEWPRGMIVKTSLLGDELLRFDRDADFDWSVHAPEPGLGIPQHAFSAGLHERAKEVGATVLEGWQATSVSEDADGGTVQLAPVNGTSGPPTVLHSSYVVGCDGAHSIVRQAAGITRTETVPLGKNLSVSLSFPDAFKQLGIEPNANFTILNGELNTLFCPYEETEWGYAIGPVPIDADLTQLDLARETRRRIGGDARFEILWSSPYPIQQRVADVYRAGRLFIAGDAAHLFPPYLGQNMNTGIDDAVNLGWKLAAVINGWGGDALLDSYSAERRPIGWRNSAASVEMSQVMHRAQLFLGREGTPSGGEPSAVNARAALGRRLYDLCYPEWNTSGVVLDQRYERSGVIIDDGSVAPPYDGTRYQPFAKPGHRAPHIVLTGGRPLVDALGEGYTLLQFGSETAPATDGLVRAAADAGVPLQVLGVADRAAARLYGAALVLIRPDQHVAWRGNELPVAPDEIIDRVRGATSATTEATK